MVLIWIIIGLWIIHALFGEDQKPVEARERFIYRFINSYADETGEVLTRNQAERLIRLVVEIQGPELMNVSKREIEYNHAKATVSRICAEAERKVWEMHRS